MTYIKRVKRVAIDPIIDGLVKRLRSIDADRHDVAYAVTRVAMEALRPQVRWTRQSLSECVDALYEAAAEIETRMVQPYTEATIQLNGDLECFQDGLAALVPCQPGEPDTFSSLGVRPGRYERTKPSLPMTNSLAPGMALSDFSNVDCEGVNPCVEVTNSLLPGLYMSDRFEYDREGNELGPISEALSDEQIKAAEEARNVQDTE
jgi:hypothetical protein